MVQKTLSAGMIETVESCLQEFGSRDFQMRVWVRGDGPEVSSFEEAEAHLFEGGLGVHLDRGEAFSPTIDSRLRVFERMLEEARLHGEVETMVQSEFWGDVVSAAEKIHGNIVAWRMEKHSSSSTPDQHAADPD